MDIYETTYLAAHMYYSGDTCHYLPTMNRQILDYFYKEENPWKNKTLNLK
jgi:hypothetical protein